MALIACGECGKEISDRASACPHCGNPLTAPVKVQVVPQKPKTSGCAWLALIFIALPVFFGVIGTCSRAGRESSFSPAPAAQPVPTLTAAQQLDVLKARWNPNAPADASHIGLLGEANGIATRFPNTPEAAEVAKLIPLIEAKVEEHQETVESEASAKKWRYHQDTDEMTGKATSFASIESENTISLDFPYQGAQRATLNFRQHPQHGFDAFVTIEQGQVLCRSYEDCTVKVRIDEGEVRNYRGAGAADHSTETVFFRDGRSLFNRLKSAKEARIQFEIYQAGAPTFIFDVSGFDEAKFNKP